MDKYAQFLNLAQSQHGLATRDQLQALGVSRNQLYNWLQLGRVERISAQVFRAAGAATTDAQRMCAAIFDVGDGAALSHVSAAAWWGVQGYGMKPIHVLVPHGGSSQRRHLANVHYSRTLQPEHVMRTGGVTLTTPARTLFDLASMVSHRRLDRTFERMLGLRLTKMPQMLTMLDELSVHGFDGVTVMRELIERRGIDYAPTTTGLEFRLREILAEASLPPFAPQVDVFDQTGWITRVDFLHPPSSCVLEADSDLYHAGLLDRANDDRTTARLKAAGYTVKRFRERTIWHEPHVLVADLRRFFRSARRAG